MNTIRTEAEAVPAFPADSYFGGKALQREAQLLDLAVSLDMSPEADLIRTRLSDQLTVWSEQQGCAVRAERCFVYDPQTRGMIGLVPAFGSEEYNDHHFHYGHFLYAAGVLARHAPQAIPDLAPVMNLLAADVATSRPNPYFPERRVFDPYLGHSWASGTAPFTDGNNQESISEAVNAWTGLALWARATGDEALLDEAQWLLALEAASGQAYWTAPDLADPIYAEYAHDFVSLTWSGKREYQTWFSPEPSAKLGIVLIPLNPTMAQLPMDPAITRQRVEVAAAGNFDKPFGDYLLMYLATAGPEDRQRALELARQLSDEGLDDGNSRSYLLAWILSR